MQFFILKIMRGFYFKGLEAKRPLMEVHPPGSALSVRERDRPGESCGGGLSVEPCFLCLK